MDKSQGVANMGDMREGGPVADSESLSALAAECNYNVRDLAERIGVSPPQLQKLERNKQVS
jgi:hypothetical protein